ncbi:phosphatase [Fragilaria crotonensis]|nr:phosphatase [Fragilaria crotonensis]
MCCCLVPESAVITKQTQSNLQTVVTTQLTEKDKENDTVRLLPPIHPDDRGKKCLVLDLDETLVHSSFRAVAGADFVIPVQVDRRCGSLCIRREATWGRRILLEMSKHYEIIIYTASLNKYADPLLDLLDTHKVIRTRLFRESCVYFEGNYVKDMSLINRDLSQSIIVDNSPNSYVFHPENAIDCSSFIDDPNDRELDQIGACLVGTRT